MSKKTEKGTQPANSTKTLIVVHTYEVDTNYKPTQFNKRPLAEYAMLAGDDVVRVDAKRCGGVVKLCNPAVKTVSTFSALLRNILTDCEAKADEQAEKDAKFQAEMDARSNALRRRLKKTAASRKAVLAKAPEAAQK